MLRSRTLRISVLAVLLCGGLVALLFPHLKIFAWRFKCRSAGLNLILFEQSFRETLQVGRTSGSSTVGLTDARLQRLLAVLEHVRQAKRLPEDFDSTRRGYPYPISADISESLVDPKQAESIARVLTEGIPLSFNTGEWIPQLSLLGKHLVKCIPATASEAPDRVGVYAEAASAVASYLRTSKEYAASLAARDLEMRLADRLRGTSTPSTKPHAQLLAQKDEVTWSLYIGILATLEQSRKQLPNAWRNPQKERRYPDALETLVECLSRVECDPNSLAANVQHLAKATARLDELRHESPSVDNMLVPLLYVFADVKEWSERNAPSGSH